MYVPTGQVEQVRAAIELWWALHPPISAIEATLHKFNQLYKTLTQDLGFSAEDRQQHNRRVIFVSKLLVRNGIIVLIPLISPYRETRAYARGELERFVEIYVKCPVEECIRRDPKGLYAKALRGEIKNFTGIDDPYEEPKSPELTVETDLLSVQECVDRIMRVVTEGKNISE